jgi:hypothetical protein
MSTLTQTLRAFSAACLTTAALFAHPALAQSNPKIAVTDLSYEEKVREYFQSVQYSEKHNRSASARESYRDSDASSSASSSGRMSDRGESSFSSYSGYQTYIDRGELRKFTSDVKGELLKSGYRVVQGKPWTQTNTEKLYDIINRIKQGYYPGADYVLWGTVNNIEFRRDDNPIQGSDAISHQLSLELVAEFSLINTRTFEIKAAFSAMGEGNDTKLSSSAGARITLNRSKVMQEVSRTLGVAVAEEVAAQFSGNGSSSRGNQNAVRNEAPSEEKVIIFK